MRLNRFQYFFKFLLVLGDIILAISSMIWAYKFRFFTSVINYNDIPEIHHYYQLSIFYAVIFIFSAFYIKIYEHKNTFKTQDLFNIFKASFITLILIMSLSFLYRGFSYSRLVYIFSFMFTIIIIPIFHYIVRKQQIALIKKGKGIINMAIAGKDETVQLIEEKCKNNIELGFRFCGYITKDGVDNLGKLENINEIIKKNNINYLIITIPSVSRKQVFELINKCEELDIMIRIVPDLFNMITSQTRFDEFNGIPLIGIKEINLQGKNLIIKRIFDIVLSFLGIIILSPFLILISLLVKLTSKGNIIYAQERIGRDGKKFKMYKFRSMRIDAEVKTGPVWAVDKDPRCTKLGAFMRKTSIDEFPQLFNVLKGDMSLVGPRPEREFFVNKFTENIPRYMVRHKVKSGITGWAQVNGLRGNTSIEKRTKYDIYYIENWSIWFDVKIIFKTITELWTHNAY